MDYCSWFKYLTDFLNFSNCNETHHIYAYYSSSPEMKSWCYLLVIQVFCGNKLKSSLGKVPCSIRRYLFVHVKYLSQNRMSLFVFYFLFFDTLSLLLLPSQWLCTWAHKFVFCLVLVFNATYVVVCLLLEDFIKRWNDALVCWLKICIF